MKALTLVTSSCLWFLLASSLYTFCFCTQNINNMLCIANERLVLLQFKNNLVDRANRLSSWAGQDCCRWSGVVCDNSTGHVHELRLRGPDDGIRGHCHGSYDTDEELEEASKQMLGGTISPSLINLTQLRYLDLSCNDFGPSKIPAFIGSFQNLSYLNVSKSQFYGEIPHNLGNLSMLRVLDLHGDPVFSNLYSESLKWLTNLKRLQHLDMSGIDLARASDWLQALEDVNHFMELTAPWIKFNNSTYHNTLMNNLKVLIGTRQFRKLAARLTQFSNQLLSQYSFMMDIIKVRVSFWRIGVATLSLVVGC